MRDREQPRIARRKAYYTELEIERTYLWCSCGASRMQPYCDGSHRGTEFRPVPCQATRPEEEVLFCGCKRTGTPPYCDGAHNDLEGGYEEDDPDSIANRSVVMAAPATDARAVLNGGCYVFSTELALKERHGTVSYCSVIGAEYGAIHQSQYHFAAMTGTSPVIGFGDREAVLFVTRGPIEIEISGRAFCAGNHSGVYIGPGEAFRISNRTDGAVKFLASVCPRADGPEWLDDMPGNFDDAHPLRVVPLDPSQQHQMANRYFQLLVGKEYGARAVTQFIGHIPRSKAVPHRHLYEEALIILSGNGFMWTENLKAPVTAGDVIFLPRKQIHSLEANSEEGMLVVGTICPGDNPAISY